MPKRFTIRTLIFATFLVALFFALPFRKARMQMEGREWVAAQRGHISFQYAVNRPTGRYPIPFVPDFLVDWFGVDMFNPVRGVCLDCDTIKDFGPVSKLSGLESIGINIAGNGAFDLFLAGYPFSMQCGSRPLLVDLNSGEQFPLHRGTNMVGRDPDIDLRVNLDYREVSRKHLVIEILDDRTAAFTDLSSHGTRVPASRVIGARPVYHAQ